MKFFIYIIGKVITQYFAPLSKKNNLNYRTKDATMNIEPPFPQNFNRYLMVQQEGAAHQPKQIHKALIQNPIRFNMIHVLDLSSFTF